jgi:hypothetical protein
VSFGWTTRRLQRQQAQCFFAVVSGRRRRAQGRWSSGLVSIDGVDDDQSALRSSRSARPGLREAARRAGAVCDQLSTRPVGRAPPDHVGLQRPAELSEPNEGPRSGRLLDRLRRPRRDGHDPERRRRKGAPLPAGAWSGPIARHTRRSPCRLNSVARMRRRAGRRRRESRPVRPCACSPGGTDVGGCTGAHPR